MLAHKIAGGGPPVLLLNGGAMSLSAWDEIARPLEASYRVIRCDFRGQLLSPGVPPPDLQSHAADVVSLLDALGVARTSIVGTSFGAEVGLLLAARRPERVASLVAVTAVDRFDAAMLEDVETLRRLCREALSGGDRGRVYDVLGTSAFSPAWREAHRAELAARRALIGSLPDAWFAGLSALLSALATFDLAPELPRISCPVCLVLAEHDAVMPRERSEALAAGLRNVEVRIVAGSGHGVVLERPAEVTELCTSFIAGLGAPG